MNNNKVHNVHLNQSLQLYLSQSNCNSQLEVVHKKTMKDCASKRRLSNFPYKLYSLFDNNKNRLLGTTKAKLNRDYINASMTLLTPKIKSFNPNLDYSLPYNNNYVKSSSFYQNKASASSLSFLANLTKLTSISKKISLKALNKREISKKIQKEINSVLL